MLTFIDEDVITLVIPELKEKPEIVNEEFNNKEKINNVFSKIDINRLLTKEEIKKRKIKVKQYKIKELQNFSKDLGINFGNKKKEFLIKEIRKALEKNN